MYAFNHKIINYLVITLGLKCSLCSRPFLTGNYRQHYVSENLCCYYLPWIHLLVLLAFVKKYSYGDQNFLANRVAILEEMSYKGILSWIHYLFVSFSIDCIFLTHCTYVTILFICIPVPILSSHYRTTTTASMVMTWTRLTSTTIDWNKTTRLISPATTKR